MATWWQSWGAQCVNLTTLVEILPYLSPPLSLETEIDLNSEKGFALKEVERFVGCLRPEKLALISSSSRGQRLRLLSAWIVYKVAQARVEARG